MGVLDYLEECLRLPPTRKEPALFFGVCDIAVLNAQHNVGLRAATWRLLEKPPGPQRRCQAGHPLVRRSPSFTVVICLPVAPGARAVPNHLLRPLSKLCCYLLVSSFHNFDELTMNTRSFHSH